MTGSYQELTQFLLDKGGKLHRDGQVSASICATRQHACGSLLELLRLNTMLPVQFVDLGNSDLSAALVTLPQKAADLDSDWEVDPQTLQMLEKLGAHLMYSPDSSSTGCYVLPSSQAFKL